MAVSYIFCLLPVFLNFKKPVLTASLEIQLSPVEALSNWAVKSLTLEELSTFPVSMLLELIGHILAGVGGCIVLFIGFFLYSYCNTPIASKTVEKEILRDVDTSSNCNHCVCSVAQSCLFATPGTIAPPGSTVLGIIQARILKWVAIPSPGYLSDPGIKPASPALAGFFTTSATWEAWSLYCINRKWT